MNKISYKIALGGVMASVCLLLMFLTAVFPLLSMAIPIYAGAILVIVAVEIDSCWAFVTYAACAFLCLFITPDKEAVVLFISFFGYYPVLRRILEKKIHFKPALWICKAAVFTAAIIAAYYFIINVFGVYDLTEEFGFLGKHMVLILILFAEGMFILYDTTLAMLETVYVKWFRKTYLGKK